MKKPSISISTLADTDLADCRCYACGHELPGSTHVEAYTTSASTWIVAECPSCKLYTPFQLRKEECAMHIVLVLLVLSWIAPAASHPPVRPIGPERPITSPQ